MVSCTCSTKTIVSFDDLCARHKLSYSRYEKTIPVDDPKYLRASEWIRYRLQAESEHPAFYAELDRQASRPEPMRDEYIEKMRVGLTAAVLAIDHLLGPNWFRADPDDVAAVQACFNGLDAHQMLEAAGTSPPAKIVLNHIMQRVKLDGYMGDSITDVCGCPDQIKTGDQLCPFHRQHYFAYRQRADAATMLSVQQWAQKRRSPISVWSTKGGLP